MSFKTLIGLAAALLVAGATAAAAQIATPSAPGISKPTAPVTATAKKPKVKKTTTAAKTQQTRTAQSIACSAKADTAGPNGVKLTGKTGRKAFMNKCKKEKAVA